jgi:hypothetical protein
MNIREALDKFFSNVIKDVRNDQNAKGMRASGRSADSLVYGTDNKGGQLEGSSYFYFQIYGRNAGGMPPVSDIKAWIQAKGLDLNPYAVAKSIANKGTQIYRGKKKGLEFDAITEKNLKELDKDLGNLIGVSLTNNLSQAFGPQPKSNYDKLLE